MGAPSSQHGSASGSRSGQWAVVTNNDHIRARDVNVHIRARDVNVHIRARDVNVHIRARDVNVHIRART
jgi:hypothetical protein